MGAAACPPDPDLSLRAATPGDAPCIAAIARAAMPDDLNWNYCFPDWHRHPDDHRRWTKRSFEEYFAQPERYFIEAVVAADNEGGDDVPIAFGLWVIDASVPHRGGDQGVPFDQTQPARRRDVHAAHFRAFRRQMKSSFDSFLGHYGSAQLHLELLATHPLFRGRGAASLLVRAGLERARARNMPTTVLASPIYQTLYVSLGFMFVGGFVVTVDGEEERLRIGVLENRAGLGPFVGKRKGEERDDVGGAVHEGGGGGSAEKDDTTNEERSETRLEETEAKATPTIDDLHVGSLAISIFLDM